MNTTRHIFRLVLTLLLLAGASRATTLQRMSLDELVAASGAVVRARAVSSVSRWENGHIWTFTTFEVLETMKGGTPSRVEVRLIGGRVGSLTSKVDGVPRFAAGDEAFLFLATTPSGHWTVTGWALGTFRIARDSSSGKESVTQDAAGTTLFDPATRAFRAGGVRRMPVEEFREQLAAAVTRTAGRQR